MSWDVKWPRVTSISYRSSCYIEESCLAICSGQDRKSAFLLSARLGAYIYIPLPRLTPLFSASPSHTRRSGYVGTGAPKKHTHLCRSSTSIIHGQGLGKWLYWTAELHLSALRGMWRGHLQDITQQFLTEYQGSCVGNSLLQELPIEFLLIFFYVLVKNKRFESHLYSPII